MNKIHKNENERGRLFGSHETYHRDLAILNCVIFMGHITTHYDPHTPQLLHTATLEDEIFTIFFFLEQKLPYWYYHGYLRREAVFSCEPRPRESIKECICPLVCWLARWSAMFFFCERDKQVND